MIFSRYITPTEKNATLGKAAIFFMYIYSSINMLLSIYVNHKKIKQQQETWR